MSHAFTKSAIQPGNGKYTNYRVGASGYGFITSDKRFYLVRCPECASENYALAVSSGECAFCGAKPELPEAA